MGFIVPVRGKTPVFGDNCYIAPNATIVGDVVMGSQCTIWFNAVVRGDVHFIRMGDRVNVQDGAIIHGTFEKSPTVIGNNVSIAHAAVVHGCTIHDNVLVGIGAIILDDAVIESNVIIAAGALVAKGTHVESGSVYAGVPAKKIKSLSPELLESEVARIANSYIKYASWYSDESA